MCRPSKKHSFVIEIGYDAELTEEEVRHNVYCWLAVYAHLAPQYGFYFSEAKPESTQTQ